jgi:hypothetical protein
VGRRALPGGRGGCDFELSAAVGVETVILVVAVVGGDALVWRVAVEERGGGRGAEGGIVRSNAASERFVRSP